MRLKGLHSIAAMAVAGLLGGCGLVNDPEVPLCPEHDDMVTLRFKVSSAVNATGHELTRADDNNHEEVESEIPQVEDMVNVNDFAFFIFAGDGDSAPMVCANTDIAQSTDPNMSITGSLGAYDVSVIVKKEILEKYLDRELDPNSTVKIKFRFVVIANSKARRFANGDFSSLPMTTLGTSGATSPTTFAEFMTTAQQLTYQMTADYYNTTGESLSARVDGLIPMFGHNAFTVQENMIYKSRPEDRIYLGEINLLRAVSKIRIVDAIPRDGGVYPRISGATFTFTSSTGSVLPKNASGYTDGYQVHESNIPTQTDVNTTVNFLSNPKGYATEKADGTTVVYPEWLIYSPEQEIKTGTVPAIDISVKPSATESDVHFIVPMSGYKGVDFSWNGSEGFLLRNHVYTLQVNSADIGTPLDISVKAQPWTQQHLTLDYEANPSVSNKISWTPGTYSQGENTNEIVIKPWDTNDNRVAAECSFKIDTPKDQPWTAFLITTEGTQGAFRFLNSDGTTSDSFSGVVGTAATLRIVSTEPNPTVKSSAMLQVVVDMGYGFMEAPVAGSLGNYIIIQETQQ